ncbi:hypothetical protein AAIA72_13660 [Hahella sp. SMD15-11]|uniref:Uncharacterized protein n=1 Tax=Thermohahella caldifontis TaxID=3142973 RepID=A0AB39UVJ2_9GAMM
MRWPAAVLWGCLMLQAVQPARADESADEMPDLDMLIFLGEMVASGDQWLDPRDVEELESLAGDDTPDAGEAAPAEEAQTDAN